MAIFNSYVKLPEGICQKKHVDTYQRGDFCCDARLRWSSSCKKCRNDLARSEAKPAVVLVCFSCGRNLEQNSGSISLWPHCDLTVTSCWYGEWSRRVCLISALVKYYNLPRKHDKTWCEKPKLWQVTGRSLPFRGSARSLSQIEPVCEIVPAKIWPAWPQWSTYQPAINMNIWKVHEYPISHWIS